MSVFELVRAGNRVRQSLTTPAHPALFASGGDYFGQKKECHLQDQQPSRAPNLIPKVSAAPMPAPTRIQVAKVAVIKGEATAPTIAPSAAPKRTEKTWPMTSAKSLVRRLLIACHALRGKDVADLEGPSVFAILQEDMGNIVRRFNRIRKNRTAHNNPVFGASGGGIFGQKKEGRCAVS